MYRYLGVPEAWRKVDGRVLVPLLEPVVLLYIVKIVPPRTKRENDQFIFLNRRTLLDNLRNYPKREEK
jgi:hypothetical protein